MKEIKTGCLAVFFTFGYYVQATATGEGLVESWAPHIADPFAVNGMASANVALLAPFPMATFATAAW